ncbi:hypothetical protein HNO89_001785 [Sporosarcina luteola]|nr:hypothetical protein [Sporosarcina luteola]
MRKMKRTLLFGVTIVIGTILGIVMTVIMESGY